MNGVDLIREERQRQLDVEGWTPEHDDEHDDGEIARAAAWYALSQCWRKQFARYGTDLWPRPWRFKETDRMRELVIAGALIAAEIDRLQRVAAGEGQAR